MTYPTTWNAEQLDELTRLVASGMSAREISAKINRSRSAIIGRAGRLGLVWPNAIKPKPKPTPTWTPEREDALRAMWAEGLISKVIAQRLCELPGPPVSRMAVGAKSQRMGLPKRTPARPIRTPKPAAQTPPRVVRTGGVSFLALEAGQCRFPLSDGTFCGEPATRGHKPGKATYCAACAALAYSPDKPRKPRPARAMHDQPARRFAA